MKYNLNSLKKAEQVIFQAFKEIPKDSVGFTELTNSITGNKVYFLIHNATAYIDMDFVSEKLQLAKSQIFKLIDENNILVDSYTFRTGTHYYLTIEDALLLVKESAVKDKQNHIQGLQFVFLTALEKYAKSMKYKIRCKQLKLN